MPASATTGTFPYAQFPKPLVHEMLAMRPYLSFLPFQGNFTFCDLYTKRNRVLFQYVLLCKKKPSLTCSPSVHTSQQQSKGATEPMGASSTKDQHATATLEGRASAAPVTLGERSLLALAIFRIFVGYLWFQQLFWKLPPDFAWLYHYTLASPPVNGTGPTVCWSCSALPLPQCQQDAAWELISGWRPAYKR